MISLDPQQQAARDWFESLRDRICAEFEKIEAEAGRDRDRLRLQNELVLDALAQFQEALVAFSERPDYDAILTGVAAEVLERLRLAKGKKVKMRFRAEDAAYGPAVAKALVHRFPDIDVVFDDTPEPMLGGVLLFSEEE